MQTATMQIYSLCYEWSNKSKENEEKEHVVINCMEDIEYLLTRLVKTI